MRDPINGTALGQSTAATQWMFAKAAGARGGRKSAARRAKKKRVKSSLRRRGRATSLRSSPRRRGRKARLVKGSAAARRHMARLRRMRKRK